MDLLDVAIVALLVAAALAGYRLGFLTRAVSWAGLAGGLALGARAAPAVVRAAGPGAGHDTRLVVAVATLFGAGLLGQSIGLLVGSRLSVAVRSRPGRRVDQGAGALAGLAGALLALWLVLPGLATVPGWPARQVRRSALARAIDRTLPAPPDTTRALGNLLGNGSPEVFRRLGPTPPIGDPPAASGLDSDTATRVAASTVRVQGEACRFEQAGSGFVVAPSVVVTNAHVVAGEDHTTVTTATGRILAATVVAFDPERDVAVLRVPGLTAAPLEMRAAPQGRGAVMGHPNGGPLVLSPFRVAETVEAEGTDIYGRSPTTRRVLILASSLAPGDSGAALVSPDGTVAGMAFAIAPDRPGVAYALDVSEVEAVLGTAGDRATSISTGPCVAS